MTSPLTRAPAGRAGRLAGSVLALTAMVLAPVLLVAVGRWPSTTWFARLPGVLLEPDDGTLLLGLVTAVAWVAWAVLALALVTETVSLVSRRRISWRLPGLGAPQRWMATLLLSLVPLSIPAPVAAAPGEHRPAEPVAAALTDSGTGRADAASSRSHPAAVHVVQPGDDLWSIAERWYGDGTRWRQLAEVNSLDDAAHLEAGWRLRLPDVSATEVTVARGDTLTGIAATRLGDADLAISLFEANRDRLSDPDQLEVGQQLRLQAPAEKPAAEQDPPSIHSSDPRPTTGNPGVRGEDDASTPAGSQGPAVAPPPAAEEPSGTDAEVDTDHGAPAWLATGALLPVGLAAAIAARRRIQQAQRPLGRRALSPGASSWRTTAATVAQAEPGRLDLLRRAIVHLDVCSREFDRPLAVRWIRLHPNRIDVAPVDASWLPPGWERLDETTWTGPLPAASIGHDRPSFPLPRLVSLGRQAGAELLVDLDVIGGIEVADPTTDTAEVGTFLLADLLHRAWADPGSLQVVGGEAMRSFVAAADVTTLEVIPDLTSPADPGTAVRLDPTGHHLVRSTQAPIGRGAALELFGSGGEASARLRLADGGVLHFTPYRLSADHARDLGEMVVAATTTETEPAPWWAGTDPPDPGADPPRLTLVGSDPAPQHTTTASPTTSPSITSPEAPMTPSAAEPLGTSVPTLRLLGDIDLLGARGTPPPRARQQCIEYAAWLLAHPGRTSAAMTTALLVAEGTRRSNMSRLRSWLGEDDQGEPYLPDAYSGRIRLHPHVTSDWEEVSILVAGGVDAVGTGSLVAALQLVGGAPLASAAPGQWCWAEELRIEMSGTIRDIAVVLARRSLAEGDIDGARWAAARGLGACPMDELLLVERLRTEHRAGSSTEVRRLAGQLTATARELGIDLLPETVQVLQEVVEGRLRARI